jgi:RNA polymerase sigma factor (sigma-70 family)
MGVDEMDAEEVVNDAVIILIQKVETQKYVYSGNDPCSYAIEIAKKLIYNLKRKKQIAGISLSEEFDVPDFDTENYMESKDKEEILGSLLLKISENCRNLIQLKYLDGFKDEEILNNQLTQYTSINTLKVKRSECMKKLGELAQNIKF